MRNNNLHNGEYMGLISYILNTDSRRSLKKIDSQAEKILALAPKYEGMTDAELKDQTLALKDRLRRRKRSGIQSSAHAPLQGTAYGRYLRSSGQSCGA